MIMRKKINAIIKMLILTCVMVVVGTNTTYAENNALDKTLTEEQIVEQAKQLMELESKNTDKEFAVFSYDINDLYECDSLNYIIHDYRAGMKVPQMLAEIESEIGDRLIRRWELPYKSQSNENCVAIFIEQNGELVLCGGRLCKESTYDMKLEEGKYEEISMNEVEEVLYLELSLYHMHVTYIRMQDGKEYMIPYMSGFPLRWTKFENGKVYTIDTFFERMYNCYDEPTKEEIAARIAEYKKTGKLYIGEEVSPREVPLDQLNQSEQADTYSAVYGMAGFATIIAIICFVMKVHRNKKVSI